MPTYSNKLASKLPNVGTTIFTVMSRLAQEHNAINLSQGFPDFECAPQLRELVTKYFNAGLNQYPPMAGIMALRERITGKVAALYNANYDPEHEVTIVPGATYGIFTAISAFVRPGDEVIVLSRPTTAMCRQSRSTAAGPFSCGSGTRNTASTGRRCGTRSRPRRA